jgi:protein SCO1/2
VLLTLVYYECPMLCTLTLNGLTSALGVLSFDVGKEFEVVTVSFEPKETPELAAAKKAAYLKRYKREGAERGWHFLVGDKHELDRLTGAVGFRYAWDERTKQWAHPSGVVTLTPQGRISHYLFGIEYAPKDLRLSLVEAAQGNIGTAVDQVLLYCYQYDPATGRYGAAIMRLVRALSVLTVIALLGFILTMWRRDRLAHG